MHSRRRLITFRSIVNIYRAFLIHYVFYSHRRVYSGSIHVDRIISSLPITGISIKLNEALLPALSIFYQVETKQLYVRVATSKSVIITSVINPFALNLEDSIVSMDRIELAKNSLLSTAVQFINTSDGYIILLGDQNETINCYNIRQDPIYLGKLNNASYFKSAKKNDVLCIGQLWDKIVMAFYEDGTQCIFDLVKMSSIIKVNLDIHESIKSVKFECCGAQSEKNNVKISYAVIMNTNTNSIIDVNDITIQLNHKNAVSTLQLGHPNRKMNVSSIGQYYAIKNWSNSILYALVEKGRNDICFLSKGKEQLEFVSGYFINKFLNLTEGIKSDKMISNSKESIQILTELLFYSGLYSRSIVSRSVAKYSKSSIEHLETVAPINLFNEKYENSPENEQLNALIGIADLCEKNTRASYTECVIIKDESGGFFDGILVKPGGNMINRL